MSVSPIIIIGMHRSGTSLLTRLLGEVGLYIGTRVGENYEAVFFQDINRWLLQRSGGSWVNPSSMDTLLRNTEYREVLNEYIRFVLKSPRAIKYLGWLMYLRYRDITRLDFPWGWKDPRNTYTLPMWLDIFPDAKVLHIYRNGVDVTSSLKVRADRSMSNFKDRVPLRAKFRYIPPLKFPNPFVRYMTLEQGFKLWEAYTVRADEHIASLPSDRARTIQYETFLQDPFPALQSLRDFMNLPISDKQLAEVSATVDSQRAFAYKNNTELVTFYNTVKHSPQMVKYGY